MLLLKEENNSRYTICVCIYLTRPAANRVQNACLVWAEATGGSGGSGRRRLSGAVTGGDDAAPEQGGGLLGDRSARGTGGGASPPSLVASWVWHRHDLAVRLDLLGLLEHRRTTSPPAIEQARPQGLHPFPLFVMD